MLLVLFLVAVSLRLAMGAALIATGRYEGESQHRLIAQGLVEGRGFVTASIEGLDPRRTGILLELRSFRPPLYPLLLAGVYLVLGRSDLPVLILQAVTSALVPPLIFAVGLHLFTRGVALVAALATAAYPYSIYHDVRPFETPLFEVSLAMVVLSLLRLATHPDVRGAILAGLLLGLATATRSFFLAFPIVVGCWLPLGPRVPLRRSAALVGILVLAAGVVLAPWTARNYRIHRAFVPTTTYGGWNLYLGNNEWALEAARRGEEVDRRVAQELNAAGVDLAGLTEVELDRWFYRRAVEYALGSPGEALVLLGYKTWNLWSPILNPPSHRGLLNVVHALSYGPVLLLGLAGMAGSLRQSRRHALLYGLFAYFTLTYSAYLTMSRYRKPLDPYLMLFAASFVLGGFGSARARGAGIEDQAHEPPGPFPCPRP